MRLRIQTSNRLLVVTLCMIFFSSCAMLFKTHYMDSVTLNALKDGVYEGRDGNPMCSVRLNVSIEDGKISDIKILSRFFTYPLAIPAYLIIPKRIVEKQSLDVDAVTMATVSSNGIKKAVLRALEKATGIR